jgi:hypothetical protein
MGHKKTTASSRRRVEILEEFGVVKNAGDGVFQSIECSLDAVTAAYAAMEAEGLIVVPDGTAPAPRAPKAGK